MDFATTHRRNEEALARALALFRSLLGSASSSSWRLVPSEPIAVRHAAAHGGAGGSKAPIAVTVHRRTIKRSSTDVLRATTEITLPDHVDVESFKAVLQTPEVRQTWDKLVDQAATIEQLDAQTHIAKTDYRLGWPASPRDTVTIERTFSDAQTLIHIATSLPRSPDEPVFLRPAPPFVRSDCHLLAWCIQIPAQSSPNPAATSTKQRCRITLFWQWNLRGAVLATHHQHVAALVAGFVAYVRTTADTLPTVSGYGRNLEFGSSVFDPGQDLLTIEYAVVSDQGGGGGGGTADVEGATPAGVDALAVVKERRRLERAIEILLPISQGWDVAVAVESHVGAALDPSSYTVVAERGSDGLRSTLRIVHASIDAADQLVKARVLVRRLVGGKTVRVNGAVTDVAVIEPRDPSTLSRHVLDDAGSAGVSSLRTEETAHSGGSATAPETVAGAPSVAQVQSARANSIASLVRRSYIYFTSLLQEPDAKWRPVTDARGVTITQLRSIDPTLTIFRAEATFVGVGVWDVFSTIASPGARTAWDPTFDSAALLDDVGELSSLWHVKTKPAWPAWARDAILVRTTYKSPSSIHVFAFSTADKALFPSIPSVDGSSTIRLQTDLQGWSIEALSPTTTQITLIEQSDPKGWASKSWISQQMVQMVAGVGEFAIKSGGPPVLTRLVGAKASVTRYDPDKASLRLEYAPAVVPPVVMDLTNSNDASASSPAGSSPSQSAPSIHIAAEQPTTIECEIRCDMSVWASSLEIVTDPPPSRVSCLMRHRLSAAGGGCWITIEHDSDLVGAHGNRVLVLVRQGPAGSDKGSVIVNGARQVVDTERMGEDKLKDLALRKRVKTAPIPLDQFPTATGRATPRPSSPNPAAGATVAMNGHAHASTGTASPVNGALEKLRQTSAPAPPQESGSQVFSTPVAPSIAVAATNALVASTSTPVAPMGYALEALATLQRFHAEQTPELGAPPPGWIVVSERAGASVRKRVVPTISDTVPVLRCDRVIQGVTAEQIVGVVTSPAARRLWDERIESVTPLESFGFGASTSMLATKSAYLAFRGRVFYVAAANAHFRVPSASASRSTSTVFLCANASFPSPPVDVAGRLNPSGLPTGHVLLEGWILETLDPYTSDTYAIPSTRCAYFSAFDYAGAVPGSFGSMMNANPTRMLDAVAKLARAGSAVRLQSPSITLQIEGPLSHDVAGDTAWRLDLPASRGGAAFVLGDLLPASETFRTTIALPKPIAPSSAPSSSTTDGRGHQPTKSLPGAFKPASGTATKDAQAIGRPSSALDLRRKASAQALRTASSSQLANGPPSSSSSRRAPGGVDRTGANAGAARAVDLLVAELIVDLPPSVAGYALSLASTVSASDEETIGSLDRQPWTDARDLPLRVSVHELPASALAPSAPHRAHLVRVTLPTAHITDPVVDPLQEGRPRAAPPAWYARYAQHGALVDLSVVSVPAGADGGGGGAGGGAGKPVVTLNGDPIAIAGERDSRALVERFEDDDWAVDAAKLSRVSRRPKSSTAAIATADKPASPKALFPIALISPLARSPLLLVPPPSADSSADAATGRRTSLANSRALSSGDKAQQLAVEAGSDVAKSRDGSPGPLAGILDPLSRLVGLPPTTPTSAAIAAGAGSNAAEGASEAVRTAAGARAGSGALGPGGAAGPYSLGFVLVVALVAFLCGSLLRSLLTPADFVLDTGAAGGSVDLKLLSALHPDRRWRQARRLFELRFPSALSPSDIMCATVRKSSSTSLRAAAAAAAAAREL